MLTYAFQVLKQSNYDNVSSESFDNMHDLFGAILSKGIAQQLKQGLHKEYIGNTTNTQIKTYNQKYYVYSSNPNTVSSFEVTIKF